MIRSLFVLLALSAALAQHRPPIMEDAGKANLRNSRSAQTT
jgi:hypothetical protein